MRLAALATEVTLLDVLLGVIPGAARVGHEDRQDEAGAQATDQQADHATDTEDQSGDDGGDDGQSRREDHLLLRAAGRDLDTTGVVGLRLTGQDALDLAELAAYLLDHVPRGPADGVHRQSAEHEGHHRTDEHARQHLRVHQRDVVVDHEVGEGGLGDVDRAAVGELQRRLAQPDEADLDLLDVRGQQGESRQRGRSDGEALAGSGGGVAQRVERVGPLAYLLAQVRHLGVAARVVGDRPVGVCRQRDAQRREHADGGDADAVKTHGDIREVKSRSEQERADDTDHDGDHRHGGREHTQSEAGDDNGRRTCQARF